ncbi:MAG: hypothetical protein K2P70_03095 [Hyphomonadaceae bacterium]|nr:hypothetical protein [Hyphomonadaceae bacterium]
MLRSIIAITASLALVTPPVNAERLHDALEAYALYQNDVSTMLDVDIENARTVDAALARLQRHNPDRVSRGWIAYGALTAARSPRFADSIENMVDDDGRSAVLRLLRSDTGYARRQRNSDQAIRLILTAASADAARTEQAGSRYDRFARSAGSVQLAATGSADLPGLTRLSPDMLERLRGTGRVSRTRLAYGESGFWDAMSGRDGRAARARGGSEERSYATVTDHMLTIAAIVVIDAERAESRRVDALLDEPLTQQCMEMQRLQLRQCLSVSIDASERAYCLGRHALAGPGSCFSAVVR